MKTRREIRATARQAMANRRGVAIFLPIMLSLVMIGIMFIPMIGMVISYVMDVGVLFFIFAGILFIVLVLSDVLFVGFFGAYGKIYRDEDVGVGEIFSGYRHFGRNWLSILWMSFMIFVWMFLMWIILFVAYIAVYHTGFVFIYFLLIPAMWIFLFAKAFSYSVIWDVLHQSAKLSPIQALRASVKITKGHLWSMFVMQLSFIGWYILGILTLGILLIVFVTPYINTSVAGHYVEMRKKAIANEIVTEEELA